MLPELVKYVIRKEKINGAHKRGGQRHNVRKYCIFKQICQHCKGEHDELECREYFEDCINCKSVRVPVEQRRHSARDRNCPIYIRRENAAR